MERLNHLAQLASTKTTNFVMRNASGAMSADLELLASQRLQLKAIGATPADRPDWTRESNILGNQPGEVVSLLGPTENESDSQAVTEPAMLKMTGEEEGLEEGESFGDECISNEEERAEEVEIDEKEFATQELDQKRTQRETNGVTILNLKWIDCCASGRLYMTRNKGYTGLAIINLLTTRTRTCSSGNRQSKIKEISCRPETRRLYSHT